MDFDPLKLSQAMEAMETVVDEAAQVVYTYYASLLERGFSKEQALALTNIFQSIWWAAMFRSMSQEGGHNE